MCFKPMDLSDTGTTIRKSNPGDALSLPPTALAIDAVQMATDVHSSAFGDGFNIPDFAEDLKFHYQ
jgi:hypothetical protein